MGKAYTPLRRVIVLGLVAALSLGSFSTVTSAAPKNQPVSPISVPVVGTASIAGAADGRFSGIANVTSFAVDAAGQLVATGMLTGVVTDATGTVVRSIASTFSAPVATARQNATALAAPIQAAAVCDILSLVLGPIHLDLLGLVIDTNQIILNITAVSGAGNLLGNLLCAVTNLLNGGGALQEIAGLLNQILGILSGL